MAQTAGGTYYAASSELVSSWPATSLDLANQLESRFAAKAPTASPTFTGTTTSGPIGANRAADAAVALYVKGATYPFIAQDSSGNNIIAVTNATKGTQFYGPVGCNTAPNSAMAVLAYGNTYPLVVQDGSGNNIFACTSTNRTIAAEGIVLNTTASAANVHINASDKILRTSTSSIRYKTDVQDPGDAERDALLDLRPITYRSLAEADDPDRRHWGFIAEEVAEVDRRLVDLDEEGRPNGVQYDRIIPGLLAIVKRQQEQIDALTARLDAAGI